MPVAVALLLRQRHTYRMFLEACNAEGHVLDKQLSHVAADALADHDPHDVDAGRATRKCESWDLPATLKQRD